GAAGTAGTAGTAAGKGGQSGRGGPTGGAGMSAAGGSGGDGGVKTGWGQVEDPGASCKIGPLPSVDSLTANPKLPDPFTKMDGTRMADRSEWRCRREELLQEAYSFIYGAKP